MSKIESKSKKFEVRVTVKVETGDHFQWEPTKLKRQYDLPYEVLHRIEKQGFSITPETMDSYSMFITDDIKFKPNLKSYITKIGVNE